MTKSIGEGNGSLNKQEFDDVPDAFFDEVFNYESQLTQGYVEQVPNIGTIGTVEVPVELAGNVINEEGNEEENGEEESTESDTDIDGRRRRLEFEDSADESNKEIYETDNDAALDDNNEFDVNLQSNFGRVGNTYLPKDFVVAAFEEDSDTNSKKGLDSPYYSSDEEGGRKRKFPEFCMSDLNNPKFEKGMLFGSKEVLKKAVKNYAVQGNYYVKFVKNDKRRITAQCKNCTWKLHASFMQLEQTLQIKTFIDKHICHRNPTNPYVKCVFIAHKYLDRIMDEPDIKCKHLRKAVKRDLGDWTEHLTLWCLKPNIDGVLHMIGHNKRNCKNQPQDPPSGTYIDKRWTTGYPSKKKKGSGSQTSALVSEMNARGSQRMCKEESFLQGPRLLGVSSSAPWKPPGKAPRKFWGLQGSVSAQRIAKVPGDCCPLVYLWSSHDI
ncbi:uncharacterized protein Pyn_31529 [Prunus yedoensis var. nudiflora]|uniref:Transposase MuDR plant domain-containing protein n=1 Tax=Prunus yedoensis var. nudiflora TaxID=2094558 RepID=A0A314ZL22_PRUYE|nr:uncharacterized protein Pyn_31529 [Prunus yedoensis var. nudiflora]